jgi:hypothetical protein
LRPKKIHYVDAIRKLIAGMTQLSPDGNCCTICGDNDHQAWECHHNPLNINYLGRLHWRCFHCNAIFTNEQAAEEHFGKREEFQKPKCYKERR